MAITTLPVSMSVGTIYTVQTDNSTDWPSVANNTYFFDKATQKIYYKDLNGFITNLNDSFNQQIQSNGSNVTQRPIVNFTGAGVTTTDAGGKTVVTIPGATGNTEIWMPFNEPALYATNSILFMSTGIVSATESLVQVPFPACTIKNFKINVTSNTANNATTIEVRKNGVAILSTSIPGNTNGVFTATGSAAVALNDLISIRVVIPSGGSSIGLRGALLNITV